MFELYIKYLLEGIAVAVAAYFIPRKKVEITEIIFIALSAAATFAVLDIFAPKVGEGARKGAGFGIGANTVGWPGLERFEDKKANHKDEKKTEHKVGKKDMKHEDSSADTKSTDSSDSSKKSDDSSASSGKKEGFYADDKSEDSSKTSESTEAKPEQINGYDQNKAYSTF
jgi:hypothetical protein